MFASISNTKMSRSRSFVRYLRRLALGKRAAATIEIETKTDLCWICASVLNKMLRLLRTSIAVK